MAVCKRTLQTTASVSQQRQLRAWKGKWNWQIGWDGNGRTAIGVNSIFRLWLRFFSVILAFLFLLCIVHYAITNEHWESTHKLITNVELTMGLCFQFFFGLKKQKDILRSLWWLSSQKMNSHCDRTNWRSDKINDKWSEFGDLSCHARAKVCTNLKLISINRFEQLNLAFALHNFHMRHIRETKRSYRKTVCWAANCDAANYTILECDTLDQWTKTEWKYQMYYLPMNKIYALMETNTFWFFNWMWNFLFGRKMWKAHK